MRARLVFVPLAAMALLAAAPGVLADRLVIDNVRQAEQRGEERPRHGLTMEQVAAGFGEPNERVPAVGEPPISRWRYTTFTVYFEHDRVLHSVKQHD